MSVEAEIKRLESKIRLSSEEKRRLMAYKMYIEERRKQNDENN